MRRAGQWVPLGWRLRRTARLTVDGGRSSSRAMARRLAPARCRSVMRSLVHAGDATGLTVADALDDQLGIPAPLRLERRRAWLLTPPPVPPMTSSNTSGSCAAHWNLRHHSAATSGCHAQPS